MGKTRMKVDQILDIRCGADENPDSTTTTAKSLCQFTVFQVFFAHTPIAQNTLRNFFRILFCHRLLYFRKHPPSICEVLHVLLSPSSKVGPEEIASST